MAVNDSNKSNVVDPLSAACEPVCENSPDSPPASSPSDLVQANGSGTVPCRRCGADGVPGGHCWRCGGFMVANRDAVTHDLSKFRGGVAMPLDVGARDALVAAVLADKGDEKSAIVRAQGLDYAQAVLLRDNAWAHLAAVGPLTRAGRKRAAVDIYMAASARAQQLAAQIGLERKPKSVQTVTEIMKEYEK